VAGIGHHPVLAVRLGAGAHREAVADLDPVARQRREVRGVRRVLELGVVRQLRLGGLHFEPRGQFGRGLVDHLRLDRGAGLHQPLRDPLVVGAATRHRPGGVERAVGGPHQRRGAAVGLARRVRTAGEQRGDDVAVAPPRGVVQRRAAALAGAVDRDAELEQDLDRLAPALGRRLVQRVGELGPDALGALRVLRGELQRPVAVAGAGEPDQLVDRPDLAPRAELSQQLAHVRPAHPPREPVGRALVPRVPRVHVGAGLDQHPQHLRRAPAVDRPQQ
jgi:hypothetical protein